MMSARIASSRAWKIFRSNDQIRFASSGKPGQSSVVRRIARTKTLGQQIYVFNHIQTNQVVYSLTKTLKNNAALKQIPFNGKKTVPAALRKDVWSPLATISFAAGANSIGLSTFQKLREYKRLHELLWDDSLMTNEDGKFIPKKKRGRQISDQKANSVADIAAVLSMIGTAEGAEIGLNGLSGDTQVGTRTLENDVTKVEVKWFNILDAEFAETWSDNVVHDKLEWEKNNRDPENWKHLRVSSEVDKSKNKKLANLARRNSQPEATQDMVAYILQLQEGNESLDTPGSARKPLINEKNIERDEKQRKYWALQDKKREQWYLAQGKTLDEILPRKIIELSGSEPSQPRDTEHQKRFVESVAETSEPHKSQVVDSTSSKVLKLLSTLRLLEEKKTQREQALTRRIIRNETLIRKKREEQEYWREFDNRRREHFRSQGIHPKDAPRRKAVKSAVPSPMRKAELKKLLSKAKVRQEKIDRDIVHMKNTVTKETKMRDFWAELERKRIHYHLAQGRKLEDIKPRNIAHGRGASSVMKTNHNVRTLSKVLNHRVAEADIHEKKVSKAREGALA